MYFVYLSAILSFVYLAPGLCFFPRLILRPVWAFSLPLLSAVIIYGLVVLLQVLDLFSHEIFRCVLLIILISACVNIYKYRHDFIWNKSDILNYSWHFLILLPIFTKLGTHAFDRGDEIYSWNFWAIQHYLQENLDFSHTAVAYPQLLPRLLAAKYKLLNNLNLQLPVKASLGIFSYSMLVGIYQLFKTYKPNFARQVTYWALLFFVLFGIGLARFFDDGYADPLLSSFIICSVTMLVMGRSYLACLLALGAALSKQPGLLWLGFFPALLLTNNISKKIWLFYIICLSLGLSWYLGEGAGFYNNQGAFSLSFAGRSFGAQIINSLQNYLLYTPSLLILFGSTYFCAIKANKSQQKLLITLSFGYLLVSIFLWFILGAYQLRLGQHLIILSFWIIVASNFAGLNYNIFNKLEYIWCNNTRYIFSIIIFTSFGISSYLGVKYLYLEQTNLISPYNGARLSLSRYFGQDADLIYSQILQNKTNKLFVPTRYLYGLFYNHCELVSPNYTNGPNRYSMQLLIKDLATNCPNYVFITDESIQDGPANGYLKELIMQREDLFTEVSSAKNRFDFKTYSYNQAMCNTEY